MALAVLINDAMRGGLEALTRAGNTAQKLAQRARIVLLASQGHSDSEISRKLDIDRKTAALWRRRVAEPEARDQAAEPTAERDAAPGTQAPVAQPGTTEKPQAGGNPREEGAHHPYHCAGEARGPDALDHAEFGKTPGNLQDGRTAGLESRKAAAASDGDLQVQQG